MVGRHGHSNQFEYLPEGSQLVRLCAGHILQSEHPLMPLARKTGSNWIRPEIDCCHNQGSRHSGAKHMQKIPIDPLDREKNITFVLNIILRGKVLKRCHNTPRVHDIELQQSYRRAIPNWKRRQASSKYPRRREKIIAVDEPISNAVNSVWVHTKEPAGFRANHRLPQVQTPNVVKFFQSNPLNS